MLLSAVDALLAALFDTSNTASTPAVQRAWIDRSVQDAVGRSKWRKVRRELGPTVVATGEYEVDEDIRQVIRLRVGGSRPYLPAGSEDVWHYDADNAQIFGAPGIFTDNCEQVAEGAADAGADGDTALVSIRPIPTAAGLAIDAMCAVLPPAILSGTAGSVVIPVPHDLAPAIAFDGAAARGFLEAMGRADLAAPHSAAFEAAVQELARRANSRIGRGPIRLRPQRPR